MISVIVPIYNVAPYIEECLTSITRQTYTDLEVLLIDDCGTDSSMQIAEAFCKSCSGNIRFKIIHHSLNRGLSAARNTGIEAATGDFISFVDSDDYLDPHFFERLMKECNDSLMVVSAPMAVRDEEITVYRPDWIASKSKIITPDKFAEYFLLEKVCHTAWGKIVRKSLYEQVRFREGRNNEDTLFNLDAIQFIEAQDLPIRVVTECLYFYRQRENSICFAKNDDINIQSINNLDEVIEKCKVIHPELVGDLQKKQIRTLYRSIFYALETTRDFRAYIWECNKLKQYNIRLIDQLQLPNMSHYSRIFRRFPAIYWIYYRIATHSHKS